MKQLNTWDQFVGELALITVILNLSCVGAQVTFDPLSSHLLETSTGIPGANVLTKLYRQSDGVSWTFIASSQLTDTNGRIANIIAAENFTVAKSKFWFDSAELYSRTNTSTFYPFVEVSFEVTNSSEHYHVPVLLNPFGFSAYKGYFSAPNPNPPPPSPDPLTAFLLDATSGTPASNVPGSLYKLVNEQWNFIIQKNTNPNGGFNTLFEDSCDFAVGTYKLSFETEAYWLSKGYRTIFSTLEVFFNVEVITAEKHLIPILISPYSFTTYKGNSSPNPVPCLT